MIPGNANPLLLRPAGGYSISRSLRFNSSDSAYLSRTPSSAGNRKTWTWAGWVKRSALGANQSLFGSYNYPSPAYYDTGIYFNSSDQLYFFNYDTSAWNGQLASVAVFRDLSAWMHVVVSCDTNNATPVKIYTNGVQISLTGTQPSSSSNTAINYTSPHSIGSYGPVSGANYFFNGYLADIHFIDGQALTPSSFGETDATTGVWMPKAYTGTFTGNSFQLKFEDNSAATATTLGKDSSGLGNNFTPNNFSVTAGAGNDSVTDVPTTSGTDSGLGGEVRGNYCTWNPLNISGPTLSNGNLDVTTPSANYGLTYGTFGVSSGKWYWEITPTATAGAAEIGIAKAGATLTSAVGAYASGYSYVSSALKGNNNSYSSYGASYTANDVIGVALDLDAGTLVFYKNGSSQGTAYSSLTGEFFPVVSDSSNSNGSTFVANFGQRPFTGGPGTGGAAPSGFKALCSSNLTAPLITKPSTVFQALTYPGTSATQTISGLGFSNTAGLIWVKNRTDNSTQHVLQDIVRTYATGKKLSSSSTEDEGDTTVLNDSFGYISAASSTGFTLDKSGTGASDWSQVNLTNKSYAAWCWDAGGSTVTNTQGSITNAQVRASPTAGFSIICYTVGGTGSTLDTVGHGLGVTPTMFIVKNRDISDSWYVARNDFSNPARDYLLLNGTAAKATLASDSFSFSSTTIGLRQNAFTTGANQKLVVYAFAPVVGYSAMGSFSGGSGIFTYTGFRPKWLLIKQSSAVSSWIIYDTSRDTYNVMGNSLYPNLSDAEISSPPRIDFVSNGFVTRAASASEPSWTGTVIYFAVAESPFNYARAR